MRSPGPAIRANAALVAALSAFVPGGVVPGELAIGERVLRWVEAGGGRPVVVLEAGFSDTAISWAPILAPLAAETRVVAYDRAGLGASDPDPAVLTVERRAADLAALVAHVGDGPCIVVGHSYGGMLAQQLACDQPALIGALVLVDPAHHRMLDGVPGLARRAFVLGGWMADRLPIAALALGVGDRWERRTGRRIARAVTDDPHARALVAEAYVARRASRSQAQAVRDERAGIIASAATLIAADARRLPDVPLVVLSAGRGVPGQREHWTLLQAAIAAAAPQGRHVVVDDAGHAIHRDRPDVVAGAILDLVRAARSSA